jgi:hypothetical protein
MQPSRAVPISGIEAYSEFGKCGLQETDLGVHIPDEKVSVFKSSIHRSVPIVVQRDFSDLTNSISGESQPPRTLEL